MDDPYGTGSRRMAVARKAETDGRKPGNALNKKDPHMDAGPSLCTRHRGGQRSRDRAGEKEKTGRKPAGCCSQTIRVCIFYLAGFRFFLVAPCCFTSYLSRRCEGKISRTLTLFENQKSNGKDRLSKRGVFPSGRMVDLRVPIVTWPVGKGFLLRVCHPGREEWVESTTPDRLHLG